MLHVRAFVWVLTRACVYVVSINVNCCEWFQGKLGELLLSLCYQTNVGAISVEIIEARGLKAMDINGFSGKSDHKPKCQMY